MLSYLVVSAWMIAQKKKCVFVESKYVCTNAMLTIVKSRLVNITFIKLVFQLLCSVETKQNLLCM